MFTCMMQLPTLTIIGATCQERRNKVLRNIVLGYRIVIFWSFNWFCMLAVLSHWGWVTHLCVDALVSIGADIATSHYHNHCWDIDYRTLTNFGEILMEIQTYSFSQYDGDHYIYRNTGWRIVFMWLILQYNSSVDWYLVWSLCPTTKIMSLSFL